MRKNERWASIGCFWVLGWLASHGPLHGQTAATTCGGMVWYGDWNQWTWTDNDPMPGWQLDAQEPGIHTIWDAQHRLPTQTRPAPADFGDGIKASQAPPTTSLLGVGSSSPWKTPQLRLKPSSNGIKQGGLTNPWEWLQAKRGPTTPFDVGHPTQLLGTSCQPAMRGRTLSICREASGWVTKDTGWLKPTTNIDGASAASTRHSLSSRPIPPYAWACR